MIWLLAMLFRAVYSREIQYHRFFSIAGSKVVLDEEFYQIDGVNNVAFNSITRLILDFIIWL